MDKTIILKITVTDVENQTKKVIRLKEEMRKLGQEKSALLSQTKAEEQALKKLVAEEEKLNSTLQKEQALLTQTSEKIKTNQQRIEQLSSKAAIHQQKIESLNAAIKQEQVAMRNVETVYKAGMITRDEYMKELARHDVKITQLVQKMGQEEAAVNRAKVSIGGLTQENRKLNAVVGESQQKITQTKTAFSELGVKVTDSKGKLAQLGQQVEKMSYSQAQMTKEISKESAEMRKLDKVYDSTKGSIARLRAETSMLVEKANKMVVTTKAEKAERDKLIATIQKNRMEIRNFDRAISGSSTLVGEYSLGIKNAFSKIGMAIGSAVAAFYMLNRIMGKGWENFKKWEQGVMNVQTLLFQGLDVTLEGRMTRLMREYGLAIDDLTKAYFDSVSASWTVAESEKLIEQAAILAKAGVTDLAIATNGITSIMNSYRLSITQVDQVAAAFFAAQKYGKITVEGLAKTIGSLAPIAKQVGVSFQEMLAMQAELTKGGLSAHMAANALRSTFLNFIRPAAGAKKALAEIGIETGAVAVRQQGMVNILHKVAAAYEQNADVLAKLTPNVRAMIGLGILNTKAMEELDGMIKVINENYGEGSFLMSAFNNQMNTAAERAKVFKANLRLVGMEFGERFKPTSIALQKILGGLVKLFLDNTDAIFKFFKILGATMASMLAYKSVLILLNSAKVANIAITNAMTAAQAMENSTIKANTVMVRLLIPLKIAYGNVVAVVTGKISLATLAQRAWNAAMAANPIGLVIAGVVALVGVLSALATKTTAVSRAQKELNDIDVEAKKIAVDQIAEVQKLVNVIKDEHSTYQQIEEAKNRLKSINAYYLSDINQETLANGKAKESLEMYIEAIKEKARVELIAAKITEIQKRRIEVEAGQGTDPTFWQNLGNSILACGNSVVKAGADARTSFKNQKDELAALDEEEQIWTAQLQKGNDAINSQITDIQKWETELEDLRKKRQELESDTVKGIQEQIENENDEYEFEKARIEDEVTDESLANEMLEELEEIHNMNMDELNSQLLQAKKKSRDKDSEDSIKKAEDTAKEIAEKSKELIASSAAAEKGIYEKMRYDEQKAYDNLLKEYGLYGVEKEKMTVEQQKVFELLTAQHIDNLISISDKELEGKITRMEEENKAETALRYTQFQQELEALGTNEEAKKKLRQKYQENELKEQQEYLSRLITTLQEALTPSLAATESVAAIVLSEEERKQLEKRINDLKGQLAALGVQINELHPEPEKDILGMTPAKWNELKGHLAGISAGGDTLFSTFEGVTKSINDFMDAKTFTDKASAIANASTALLEGYDAVRTQIENNRLQREEYNAERQTIKIEEEYEKQKLALDSQLRSKQISEEQYNERIEDLDNQLANSKKKIEDDMDKKRKEIALRQARRDKMNAVFSTIINTAVAVVKSWPNLILSAIIAGLGAASLAMIAATPLPKYAKGKPPRQQGEGITSFSNTGKGMVIQGKGQWNSDNFVGLISPNEGIINARSMLSKDVLTLHGTPRQIASQINAYKGYGVRFAYGGAKSVDSSRPDTYIDKEMVRIIVEETIEGITEIPVVVLENDITTSQKRVVQIKSAGNL